MVSSLFFLLSGLFPVDEPSGAVDISRISVAVFSSAGKLDAQNELPNPGFEIEGDDGETSVANWQNKRLNNNI